MEFATLKKQHSSNVQIAELAEASTLVMPHEDLERTKQAISFFDRFSYYINILFGLARMSLSSYERRIDLCQAFFNGENAGSLHKKYDFIELARSLGYRGPEQALYLPGQQQLPEKILRKYGAVLCKPKDGQQGKGIFTSESQEDLKARLNEVSEPYLVQEFIPPLKDYRYVYHVDPEVTYRICYAKLRPEVQGDGHRTLASLIERAPDIPDSSKDKLTKFLLDSQLNRVPELGETVELIDTGNISKGAYSQVIRGEELAAVDKVMLTLIDDLKSKCGLKIATYCFDIGVLNPNITPETVSKNDFVFYEYQVPFGIGGYLDSEEVGENKNRVARLFASSLIRAWAARKKKA